MNACLSDFRVVNPTLRTFSAAEARIAQSSIRFNNLSAAELGSMCRSLYVRKNRRGSEGAEKVDNRKQPNADAHHSHKTRLG